MRKKILLTGASGTVGKQVLKQLIAANKYDITILCRKSALKDKFIKNQLQKINYLIADLKLPENQLKITKKYDVVIHLAAIIPPLADHKPQLANAVNSNGTKYLVNQISKSSPDAFFMYSSSISIYGDRIANPLITTLDPIKISEGDHYAETKVAAENILMNSNLDWTIFRLSAIMGVKNHKMSPLMFHMPLNTSIEICTPSDTARAFVNGIDKKEELKNKIFNLGGGQKCRTTYIEFLTKNFEINGLGNLNFPKKCFAEKNFHCGFYKDGDQLEKITNFRKNSLSDYYKMNSEAIPYIQKKIAFLIKGLIKLYMRKQSEPLHAFKNNDKIMINRFFID